MDDALSESMDLVPGTEPQHRTTSPPHVSQSLRDRLVRLAYRFSWNIDEAEDAAHDALATAFERAGELQDEKKWWPWVCRIVVQRCQLRGRRRGTWSRHAEAYGLEASRRARDEPRSEPDDAKELTRKLLHELPRRQYEVIVLRHLQGMSFQEIAEVLEISSATARVHARAGRESLRKLLSERYPTMVAMDDRSEGRP